MKIWRCSSCGNGHRAPGRLRRNDARRYCLDCSAKSPNHLLVERTCPSLESERVRAEEQRKAQGVRTRERASAKRASHAASERGQLETMARRWTRLDAWGGRLRDGVKIDIRLTRTLRLRQADIDYSRATMPPEQFEAWLAFRQQNLARPTTSTGHAYSESRRMVVTAGSDRGDALTTILHELAHLAAPAKESHGDQWRALFVEAVREATGYPVVNTGRPYMDLHAACAAAVRTWLDHGRVDTPTVPDTDSACA